MTSVDLITLAGYGFSAWVGGFVVGTIIRLMRQFSEQI